MDDATNIGTNISRAAALTASAEPSYVERILARSDLARLLPEKAQALARLFDSTPAPKENNDG